MIAHCDMCGKEGVPLATLLCEHRACGECMDCGMGAPCVLCDATLIDPEDGGEA